MRKLAVWIAIGVAIVLVGVWVLWPRLNWDGAVPRDVRLVVTDPVTALPLAGARVHFDSREVGTTDAAGVRRWTAVFPAGGTVGPFRRSGNWTVYGELTVVAPDGRSRTVRLEEVVPDRHRPLKDHDPVELFLPLITPDQTGAHRTAATSAAQ